LSLLRIVLRTICEAATAGTFAAVEVSPVDSRVREDGSPRPAARSPRRLGPWLALLGLFALVSATVEVHWWNGLDHAASDWSSSHRVPWFWNAAKVVFDVATPEVALPITLAIGLLLAWRQHRWDLAWRAGLQVALVVASVLLLKPLLAVPGPTRNPLGDHGGAFPSGHTTSTVVCAALILACLSRPRDRSARVACAALVVGIVGASVVYLSYHYVSDAVGGLLLGLLIVTLPVPVVRRQRTPVDATAAGTGSGSPLA
jgi:membrane-associated phospholipid phosphatase